MCVCASTSTVVSTSAYVTVYLIFHDIHVQYSYASSATELEPHYSLNGFLVSSLEEKKEKHCVVSSLFLEKEGKVFFGPFQNTSTSIEWKKGQKEEEEREVGKAKNKGQHTQAKMEVGRW